MCKVPLLGAGRRVVFSGSTLAFVYTTKRIGDRIDTDRYIDRIEVPPNLSPDQRRRYLAEKSELTVEPVRLNKKGEEKVSEFTFDIY